jgi:hypothetical protein
MRRIILAAALCLAAPLALAGDKAGDKPGEKAGQKDEMSCGQHLAEDAKYSQQLSTVLTHVADMYQAHAKWIGTGDAASKAEHDKLMQFAKEHRDLARNAQKMATSLESARSLPNAQHRGPPPAAVTQSMSSLLAEMRTFGQMVDKGASDGERDLQAMQKGTGGSGTDAAAPPPR